MLEQKNIVSTQKEKIHKSLKNGTNVLDYYDISVLATAYTKDGNIISGLNGIAIREMDKPIQLSIVIPNEYIKTNRKFGVVRLHDGKATRLISVTQENVITFSTDCFSIYALVAEDTAVKESDVKVNTRDNTSVILPIATMGISVMFIVGLLIKRKKRVK